MMRSSTCCVVDTQSTVKPASTRLRNAPYWGGRGLLARAEAWLDHWIAGNIGELGRISTVCEDTAMHLELGTLSPSQVEAQLSMASHQVKS